jgi:hypothetical protein
VAVVYNVISRLCMRKEILLAIIVGILVGLGLTFGLYLLRQQLGDNSTVDTIEQSRQGDATLPTEENLGTLIIQQPAVDMYTQEQELRIVGRAVPMSYIVALVGPEEFITTADDDGDFSLTVKLVAGGNRVSIVATSPDGSQETVVRSVVYSDVDLDAPASSSASPSATPRASATPRPSATPSAAPRATATPRPTTVPGAN